MRYYFLGIAGTAMASLAVLMKRKGHQVWGVDQGIYPPMSEFLSQHRIQTYSGYNKIHLNKKFEMAVIGNALSRGNEEVEEILNNKLTFTSLPELIKNEFVMNHHNIVVTGTHGKTTTTAILSWIFEFAGLSPTFLIGGIAQNFASSIGFGEGKYFIIEGDEYDSAFFDKRPKFLHYFPDHLIINNIEFDHFDIYKDLEEIKTAFWKLIRIVPSNGLIVANGDDGIVREVLSKYYSRLEFFSKEQGSDIRYQINSKGPNGMSFDYFKRGMRVGEFIFPFPGEFQVRNAVASIAIALDLDISPKIIAEAIASFKGVQRRLELWGKINGAEIYDDFAHHPTAIRETLKSMKERYANKKIVALFEPRTNTTSQNIFQHELENALAEADSIFLAPIHRSERIPEKNILNRASVVSFLRGNGKEAFLLTNYSEILDELQNYLCPDHILILLTNGNLGGQYESLKKLAKSGA
jgi:UDP-N-acetylmuramate: L-alanyl-gamma-D-glutamyl-meso-diaminopimelate ligase